MNHRSVGYTPAGSRQSLKRFPKERNFANPERTMNKLQIIKQVIIKRDKLNQAQLVMAKKQQT